MSPPGRHGPRRGPSEASGEYRKAQPEGTPVNEAQRQQGLLAAIGAADPDVHGLALRETGWRAARGLAAYRANVEVLAECALAAACPTVQALVGADAFRPLARAFWRACPPARGDLGEWGDAFPGWLEAHPSMAPWPYLGDSARLDLALHRNARAADGVLDVASLARLESTDPACLRLGLMPGTEGLRSRWPIASIHAAHQLDGAAAEHAFAAAREALAAARGEQVLVARRGWRAGVHRLDGASAAFTGRVLEGATLADALEVAGAEFDFAHWLGTALRESWLHRVELVGSRDCASPITDRAA